MIKFFELLCQNLLNQRQIRSSPPFPYNTPQPHSQAYHIKAYDITDTRGGKMPDAGNGGNSGCCVMLRIPTAGNLDTFIDKLLPNVIKRYGFSKDSKESNRLNYAMLVDEDQETRQTATLDQGAKEIRFYAKPLRKMLKINARMAFPRVITEDVADRMWPGQVNGLTNIFRIMLHISATPLPYLLTHPRETRVVMLDLRDDYVGLDGCDARLKNRITMLDTEDSIEGGSISVMQRHPYVLKIVIHHLNSGNAERLLVWTSVRPNMEMDTWCQNLVNTVEVKESNRPCIFVAYYGSSTKHKKSSGLYCNRAAANYPRAIVEADKQRSKLKSELTEQEKNYHEQKPQYGDMVKCEDGVKRLVVSKQLVQEDITEGGMSIRFPRSSQHLIRDILTLIDGAARDLGHDPEGVFICVVGGALLKEGVTLKTRKHGLPLTAQVVAVTKKNLDSMDYSKLAQLCGRIQGRRSDGRIPAFYAPTYVISKLRKAFHLQRVTLETTKEGEGQGKPPLDLLAESNRVVGFEHLTPGELIMKKKMMEGEKGYEILEAVHRGSKRPAPATTGPSGQRAVVSYKGQAARKSDASSGGGGGASMDPKLAAAFDQMQLSLGRHFPERTQRKTIRDIIDVCRASRTATLASAEEPMMMYEVMDELGIHSERKRIKSSASIRGAEHFHVLWAQLEELAKSKDKNEAWISKDGELSIIHMSSDGKINVRVDVPARVTQ